MSIYDIIISNRRIDSESTKENTMESKELNEWWAILVFAEDGKSLGSVDRDDPNNMVLTKVNADQIQYPDAEICWFHINQLKEAFPNLQFVARRVK